MRGTLDMELKNAAAVCLISLCSATLVVLIARSLDSQAATRLEPQLTAIVEELRALRSHSQATTISHNVPSDLKVGNLVGSFQNPAPQIDDSRASTMVNDGLVVYYFHSNVRCPTCQSIESQSRNAVHNYFADPLSRGELVWKALNYEQPASQSLAKKFEIMMPVVVLAKMKNGEIADWRRLDRVWALENDPAAFADYVRGEVEQMHAATSKQVQSEIKSEISLRPDSGDDIAPSENPASEIPLP